ncbi:MAG: PEP-utilizing enzyme [Desulfobacteraceae bacterium]|nr:PEP-utilizing enzyme [Desulfobacteraceae bacterium]
MIRRLIEMWRRRRQLREQQALTMLTARYHAFRVFLENNARSLELIGTLDRLLESGEDHEIIEVFDEIYAVTGELVDGLNMVSGEAYQGLYGVHAHFKAALGELAARLERSPVQGPLCLNLDAVAPGTAGLTGTKAGNLAQLRRMGLPVPDGFVITTHACRNFLKAAGLADAIRRRLETVANGQAEPAATAEAIRAELIAAPLPDDLTAAILASWQTLGSSGAPAVSVRSSGVAEDRPDHSFAGQFMTVLNVTSAEALLRAYRKVVASGFSAGAVAYRLRANLPAADFNMAVLCQVMVPARCAGVLLTQDPAGPESGRMLVSAVPGLGTLAVGGAAPADLYRPAREPEAALAPDNQIADKSLAEVADPDGGLRQVAVAEHERRQPLLAETELSELVRIGRVIENLEGLPQDIEWALAQDGTPRILQARPLRLAAVRRSSVQSAGTVLASGVCASPGKAVGRICQIHSAGELTAAAAQAAQHPRILLLPQSLVDAAQYLCDFEGVIVEAGNPTDHLANIAREYAVPMVTGTLTAAASLSSDRWVVLDADHGKVLDAPESVWSDSGLNQRRLSSPKAACEKKVLADPVRAQIKEMVVPLNLTNAYGATFSMAECRSVHDLIRLAHEMAVLSMFDAGDAVMAQAGGLLRQLDIGIPFHFLVIDLGGALSAERRRGVLGAADIRSVPLEALCRGLTTPGLSWHSTPPAAAMSGLMSRTLLDARSRRPAGSFNYALAAKDYLNLNARVEYHFAMLDAVCGAQSPTNYIRFRFKGGGTSDQRCLRRARFLCEVLEAHGFYSSMVGDLVTASLAGAPHERVAEALVMLGRLLGFSRLLDALMEDDETPRRLARAFLEGRYGERE